MSRNREYNKMCKRHRKNLKRFSKNAYPWDFGYMLDMIEEQLLYIRDFYKDGENVHAMELKDISEETKDEPTRLELVEQILSEYYAYQHTHEKYYIHHDIGGKENKKGFIVNGELTDWWIESLLPDEKENAKAAVEEEQLHWNNFWKLLATNLRELWD